MTSINDRTKLKFDDATKWFYIEQENNDKSIDVVALSVEEMEELSHQIEQMIRIRKALGKLK